LSQQQPQALKGRDNSPQAKDWKRVSLRELITDTRNGLYKPDTFYGSGVPIQKMYNIGRLDGIWNLEKLDRVRLTEEEHALFRLDPGDLLVNRVNSRELVGKCAVVDERTAGFVFESKNLRLRADHSRVLPEGIAYWLNGEGGRTQIEDKAKQAIGQATINRGDLDGIIIPLPPLAEQRRLAARLREQLAAVSAARTALQAQIAAVNRLPGALLREVFGRK
jgi:type I restriction enzyme S subunit